VVVAVAVRGVAVVVGVIAIAIAITTIIPGYIMYDHNSNYNNITNEDNNSNG
jgi:hypothetical protein